MMDCNVDDLDSTGAEARKNLETLVFYEHDMAKSTTTSVIYIHTEAVA